MKKNKRFLGSLKWACSVDLVPRRSVKKLINYWTIVDGKMIGTEIMPKNDLGKEDVLHYCLLSKYCLLLAVKIYVSTPFRPL